MASSGLGTAGVAPATPGHSELISRAVLASQSPTAPPQQRKDAVALLEQFRRADAGAILSVAAELISSPAQAGSAALAEAAASMPGGAPPGGPVHQGLLLGITMAGYQLLTELVKIRWAEMSSEQQAGATGVALRALGELGSGAGSTTTGSWPLRSKVAEVVAAVVRQRGSPAYAELLPALKSAVNQGAVQAEVACKVLAFISEDLTQFETISEGGPPAGAGVPSGGAAGASKRAFLSALTASVNDIFPLLCEVMTTQFQTAQTTASSGAPAAAAPHLAAVNAALSALTTWVDWTPMGRLGSSLVLEGCAYFLVAGAAGDAAGGGSGGGDINTALHDLRLGALDVLRAVASRRRGNETWQDYAALMDKTAAQLLGACCNLGLVIPHSQPLPQALIDSLGWEGSQAEFGARLCEVLVALGEGHYRCLDMGRRGLFLEAALTLTRHNYMRLSASMLPLWSQLTREAVPEHALAAQAAAHAQAPSPGKAPDPRSTPFTLPLDCCTALISTLSSQLQGVVPSADQGVDNYPQWADSHAEFKEIISAYRGMVKTIIRQTASLAPEQGLQAAAAYLSSSMSAAAAATPVSGGGTAPAGQAALVQARVLMESAVVMLSAVVPPLTDLAVQMASGAAPGGPALAQAVVGGLENLLRAVLGVQLPEPSLTVLHAEAIEAFGRLLAVRPDLAPVTISTILRCMTAIPMDQQGNAPPPLLPRQLNPTQQSKADVVAQYAASHAVWKAAADARLGMAASVVALAKVAPVALAPHIPALVPEIVRLWDAGSLREGERVLLWEGLLAAASQAASYGIQEELLKVVLRPLHEEWTSSAWAEATKSPADFAATFLPLVPLPSTSGQGGTAASPLYELGAREARWKLYHQVTLLERSLRRMTPMWSGTMDGGVGQGSAAGGAPNAATEQEPAVSAHLEWLLPAVGRIISCMHGLAEPSAQATLGAALFSAINDMDPIEKAVRLGEDRDVAKETSEPRCVAGPLLSDARYFVRGVRESCYMVCGLAGTNCPSMWGQANLAAVLPGALVGALPSQSHAAVRIMVRHAMVPWSQRCPHHLYQHWLLPAFRVAMPHMYERLSSGWTQLLGMPAAPVPQPGAGTNSGGGAGASTSDEVLTDTLLREVTREHLVLLNAIATPRGMAPGSVGGRPGSGDNTPRENNGGAAAGSSTAASSTGPCCLEVMLAHEPQSAQAAVAAGVSALCWPDAEGAARAVTFCRSLLSLAQVGHRELEGVVCGEVLTHAIRSLAQVSTLVVQTQILDLIRGVLSMTIMAPNPPGHAHAPSVRALLSSLPGVTPAVLQNFEAALTSVNGEKEQRGVIKQLLAAAGGDEVRKLLAAVSKVPVGGPGLAIAEPKAPKQRPGPNDPTPQDMGLPHLFD